MRGCAATWCVCEVGDPAIKECARCQVVIVVTECGCDSDGSSCKLRVTCDTLSNAVKFSEELNAHFYDRD